MRNRIFPVALVSVLLSIVAGQAAFGQSTNPVAWCNLSFQPGANLFGNPLTEDPNSDTLNNIFPPLVDSPIGPTVPSGTTIQIWNSATAQFSPPSTYQAIHDPVNNWWNASWSINYDLPLGEGALLNAPVAFTNTFIGGVQQAEWDARGNLIQGGLGPGPSLQFYSPPAITASGLYLLSSVLPVTLPTEDDSDAISTFQMLVGRDPRVGESVERLDPQTLAYSATTFEGGATWSNGAPTLNLCEAAFVVLGPPLPGDANFDGRVDINDLTIVLADYNQTGMTWAQGDFIGDGKVDINDLTIVLANYNTTSGSGLAAAPEPSCFVLLSIGAVALLACGWRRRRRAA